MALFADLPLLVRDLLLLRRGPQDLPHSESLLATLALGAVLLGALVETRLLGADDFFAAALGVVASVSVALAVTYTLLRLHERQARFVQTATALIAVAIPFAIIVGLIVFMAMPLPKNREEMTGMQMFAAGLSLVVVVWQLLVRGNIFRHALEVPLARGVTLALSLTLAEMLLAIAIAQFVPTTP